jgi:hypothetical protein
MSRVRHISAVLFARVSLALAGAAVLLFAAFTSQAQAGCGDYVFVRNAQGQLVRASTLMNGHGGCSGPNCNETTAAEPDVPNPPELAKDVPQRIPCNGPNCSRRSDLPASPAPPPSPIRSAQESTALLVKLSDCDLGEGARFGILPSGNAHELHYPQSIFHPPR